MNKLVSIIAATFLLSACGGNNLALEGEQTSTTVVLPAEDTETPVPVTPVVPAPVTPDAPAPVTPDAPAPVTPDAPAPVTPDAPVPVTPDAPVPVTPDAPVPVTPDSPAPVIPPEAATEVITRLVAIPPELSANTGVVLANVFPIVTNTNNVQLPVNCCSDNGNWMIEIDPAAQTDSLIAITWYEIYQGQSLVLLSGSTQTLGNSNDGNLSLLIATYNTGFDNDGDGINNLTERFENSNPDRPNFSSAELLGIDVVIPRIEQSSAPAIDGIGVAYQSGSLVLDGEWANAVQEDTNGNRLSIDSLMINDTGGTVENENHHWAAAHDGTYLYLLVISDDAGRHISDSNDLRKIWKDDDLEIFVDGNNSKLSSYDGVDDFQFHINLLEPIGGEANNAFNESNRYGTTEASAGLPNDFSFATGPFKGPTSPRPLAGAQDVYEIRIKLSELNISSGQPFGFEVQLNDDDDGGDRDVKWGWAHPLGTPGAEDLTWQNPSIMGTAILEN